MLMEECARLQDFMASGLFMKNVEGIEVELSNSRADLKL